MRMYKRLKDHFCPLCLKFFCSDHSNGKDDNDYIFDEHRKVLIMDEDIDITKEDKKRIEKNQNLLAILKQQKQSEVSSAFIERIKCTPNKFCVHQYNELLTREYDFSDKAV